MARQKNADLTNRPKEILRTSGPSAGQTWIYFRAPWGLQLELVSYPNGKAYEHDYDSRLWDPRHPER